MFYFRVCKVFSCEQRGLRVMKFICHHILILVVAIVVAVVAATEALS